MMRYLFLGGFLLLGVHCALAQADSSSVIANPPPLHLIMKQPLILPKIQQGIMCQLEEKSDRKNTITYRFRLGTQDYVDQLEGKRSIRRADD